MTPFLSTWKKSLLFPFSKKKNGSRQFKFSCPTLLRNLCDSIVIGSDGEVQVIDCQYNFYISSLFSSENQI